MFERYTEKARRVIFFARYEASQYGSPYIDTGHALLGLLREDPALTRRFLGETDFASEIRTEIERRITRREPFSTSVEVPLTSDCRKILLPAGEQADRLGHRSVGTEHLRLGMLRAEPSLAAQILERRGLKPADIREQLAEAAVAGNVQARQTRSALSRLCAFLAGLKWQKAEDLLPFFAMNARFPGDSGAGRKSQRDLSPYSHPRPRKTQPMLSNRRSRTRATLWLRWCFGKTPFWPAWNASGSTGWVLCSSEKTKTGPSR